MSIEGRKTKGAGSAQSAELTDLIRSEEDVTKLLHRLPRDLADRWLDENEKKPLEEQHALLTEYLERRRQAKERRPYASPSLPQGIESIETTPLAVAAYIERIQQGTHETIGTGDTATVIASQRNPDLCHKVFHDPGTLRKEAKIPERMNDVAMEAEIQDDVAKFGEMHGVRAPKIFYYNRTQDFTSITMERLHAVSIADVLRGKAELPSAFDLKKFFTALRAYVAELHNRSIYHRDLHEGNILIDNETGMPYVIDFGFARRSMTEEEAFEHPYAAAGQIEHNRLISDTGNLRTVEEKIASYVSIRPRKAQNGGV